MLSTTVDHACPPRGSERLHKNGRTDHGAQRAKCLECERTFTLSPKGPRYDQKFKAQVLAAHVSAANENERAQVEERLANVQAATGESVEVAFVDGGYNGEAVAAVAREPGVRLEVVSLPEAKKGFVLLLMLTRLLGGNPF